MIIRIINITLTNPIIHAVVFVFREFTKAFELPGKSTTICFVCTWLPDLASILNVCEPATSEFGRILI